MNEYINKEALIYDFEHCGASKEIIEAIVGRINLHPTADVAEVRHGHWELPIFTDNDDVLDPRVKCSECGKIEAAFARWNYCPNCGALMKEDEHEVG